MSSQFSASLPLRGVNVAVTRAESASGGTGGRLGELLQAQGAEVRSVPLIRFAPTSQPEALHRQLRDLRGVDWLLLTSPQGIAALTGELTALGLSAAALATVRLAAVGEATARPWRAWGVRVDFVPSAAQAAALGRELPTGPGSVALHLTSQLSEDVLRQALEGRGVVYRRLELYRTEAAVLTPTERQALREVDVVTLASSSAARGLMALATPDFDPRCLRVAAIGEQTAAAARALGFRSVTVAPSPSLEGLAQAVREALGAPESQADCPERVSSRS